MTDTAHPLTDVELLATYERLALLPGDGQGAAHARAVGLRAKLGRDATRDPRRYDEPQDEPA